MSQQQADAEGQQKVDMEKPITQQFPPEISPAENVYRAMDLADEKQIIKMDKQVKQALFYKHKQSNTIQLTSKGIYMYVQYMASVGEALKFKVDPVTKLEKFGFDDMSQWAWQSECIVVNSKTGLETQGMAEASYIDPFKAGSRDPFGKTKSATKAQRNAYRKQIPEVWLNELLRAAQKEGTVQDLETPNIPITSKNTAAGASSQNTTTSENATTAASSGKPSEKQMAYYKSLCLKYDIKDSVTPSTNEGMMARITQIKAAYNT